MIFEPSAFFQFSSLEEFLEAAVLDLPKAEVESLKKLHQAKLPPVTSINSLALLFGVPPRFVGLMVHIRESRRKKLFYRTFKLPKGKGKFRTIDAPRIPLKVLQSWLGQGWSADPARVHPHAHGFVPGRSSLTAAKQHCKKSWVASIDIRDYFPSISRAQAQQAILSLGYSQTAADLLAAICSLEGRLPQGSPASPILSNLVFKETDLALEKFATSHGLSLTRYADDIVFSSTNHSQMSAKDCLKQVKQIVKDNGWKIATDKDYFADSTGAQQVHGLTVIHEAPQLSKKMRNRVRMMEHMVDKVTEDDVRRRYQGHLAYSRMIEKFVSQ